MDTKTEHKNKEAEYQTVLAELDKFFKKYHYDKYHLSQEAKMTTIVSYLKNNISGLFFVGFYLVVDVIDLNNHQTGEQYLEVGAYQSTIVATPRIAYGIGQCGSTWSGKQTQIVEDVSICKNYIACDSNTKSEIVVPVFKCEGSQDVVAVLDIDSDEMSRFDEVDKKYLELVVSYLYK